MFCMCKLGGPYGHPNCRTVEPDRPAACGIAQQYSSHCAIIPQGKSNTLFYFFKIVKLEILQVEDRLYAQRNRSGSHRLCVGSSVYTVTTLRSAQPTNRGLTPGSGKTFVLCSKATTLPTGLTLPHPRWALGSLSAGKPARA